MKESFRIACFCLLVIAVSTTSTGAEVTVRFVEPERYTESIRSKEMRYPSSPCWAAEQTRDRRGAPVNRSGR